ncbi:MAG: ComF family protein [Pseudomonadota bacterium]
MDRTIAPWLYGEYMAFLIQRWKYAGQTRLTPLLAQLWLQRATTAHVDLLVPVPMHWSRRWRRGYNQAELLCRALHRTHPQLADRVASRLVRRNRPTAAQSGMDARSRNLNVRNAFTLQDRCDKLRVAIVDDVYTTGATARALSRALREAGAVHVEVWCVARTPAPV